MQAQKKTSIQNKILTLNLVGLVLCAVLVGWVGYFCANDRINRDAEEQLKIIGKKEATHIASMLENIEQYVKTLNYVVTEGIVDASTLKVDSTREAHTQENLNFIRTTIKNVNSAVAAYLRYNPKFAPPTSGVFMAKTSKHSGIQKQVPTDFSKYDPSDIEHVGWYYIPVKTGKALWMDPYENKNIDIYMISYVIPLFKFGEEMGVIGVDIDFKYLTSEIAKIKLFDTGYAYLEDANGKIAYHPQKQMGDTLVRSSNFKYTSEPLPNGMNLVLVAPISKFNEDRDELTMRIAVLVFLIILAFALVTIMFARSITRPLTQLTKAANDMTNGNLDVTFETNSNDEIGELGRSFSAARDYIKEYLGYVKGIAYKDSLTGFRNRNALDNFIKDFNDKLDGKEVLHFGIVVLDVNDLKKINDTYGHNYGNKLLICARDVISKTFTRSPIFRTGGDEFIVILQHIDYTNRERLMELLQVNMAETEAKSSSPWESVSFAAGLATYDFEKRESFDDVLRRADEAMYRNKREIKANQ